MRTDRVEGYSDLVKDRESGAILNCDFNALKQARETRDRILKSRKAQEETDSRLNTIEEKLDSLLMMLEKMGLK